METTSWRKKSALEILLKEPQCFDFFQAVRLIEQYFYEHLHIHIEDTKDILLNYNLVRFQASLKSSFPIGLIESVYFKFAPHNIEETFFSMVVSFMGLTGPNGVLPHHYHELLTKDSYHGKGILHDFFEIFNHRILSLLYLAWSKYNLLVNYEKTKVYQIKNAPFNSTLNGLLGIKEYVSDNKYNINQILHFYSGTFSNKYRSAATLENLLNEYFNLPLKILQFQGKWIFLNKDEYSVVASRNRNAGSAQQIGINFILGKKCWDIQNKFRIYIGPISYEQFQQLIPNGTLMQTLIEITRFYAGTEFDFDIQIELFAGAIKGSQLCSKNSIKLGWNAWTLSKPLRHNANNTIMNIKNQY